MTDCLEKMLGSVDVNCMASINVTRSKEHIYNEVGYCSLVYKNFWELFRKDMLSLYGMTSR